VYESEHKLEDAVLTGTSMSGPRSLDMGSVAPRRDISSKSRSKTVGRRKRPAKRFAAARPPNPSVQKARRKFLRAFPGGFRDDTYLEWERDYKWKAHLRWQDVLSEPQFRRLLDARQFSQIASLAIGVESRTNLLFSFEKMALRDAVRPPGGAQAFATALFDLLHGSDPLGVRFSSWIAAVAALPRRQTRVLTWPLVTVFGFIAQPKTHFFFKPTVTREAARRYGVKLPYAARPSWPLYKDLLSFVRKVRGDISDMRPRDMIDMQSFLWVQGSDEYPD
jgi:hypothetical protein